jgi:hypothetical protein
MSLLLLIFFIIMSFHVHITNTANDTYKRLDFIIRNSEHLNDKYIYALSLVFNGIVRSKVEYASIIWSPVHKSNQNQIEQI